MIVSNGYDKLNRNSKGKDIDYINDVVHLIGALVSIEKKR
jgi:hypothetical protein